MKPLLDPHALAGRNRPLHGGRGLKPPFPSGGVGVVGSPPSRGARIETERGEVADLDVDIAPFTGGAD